MSGKIFNWSVLEILRSGSSNGMNLFLKEFMNSDMFSPDNFEQVGDLLFYIKDLIYILIKKGAGVKREEKCKSYREKKYVRKKKSEKISQETQTSGILKPKCNAKKSLSLIHNRMKEFEKDVIYYYPGLIEEDLIRVRDHIKKKRNNANAREDLHVIDVGINNEEQNNPIPQNNIVIELIDSGIMSESNIDQLCLKENKIEHPNSPEQVEESNNDVLSSNVEQEFIFVQMPSIDVSESGWAEVFAEENHSFDRGFDSLNGSLSDPIIFRRNKIKMFYSETEIS